MRDLDLELRTVGAHLAFDEVCRACFTEVAVICDVLGGGVVFPVCTYVLVDLIHRLEIRG